MEMAATLLETHTHTRAASVAAVVVALVAAFIVAPAVEAVRVVVMVGSVTSYLRTTLGLTATALPTDHKTAPTQDPPEDPQVRLSDQ